MAEKSWDLSLHTNEQLLQLCETMRCESANVQLAEVEREAARRKLIHALREIERREERS